MLDASFEGFATKGRITLDIELRIPACTGLHAKTEHGGTVASQPERPAAPP